MIRIGKYGIDASDRCYCVGKLYKITNKKTGEEIEYISNGRYYGTLKGALSSIRKDMHLEAIMNMNGDLQAAIEALRKADEQFEKLISGIEVEG